MSFVREQVVPILLAGATLVAATLAVGAPLPLANGVTDIVGTSHVGVNADGASLDAGTYRTIVIFRDDDAQPYYKNEELRAVNRVFASENVPVTLGVIPAPANETVDPTGEFCTYLRTLDRQHPGLFEFSLHGTTHEETTDFYGRSEFGGLAYGVQRDRIARGARALESCTGSAPTSFVPPFNTYDESTVAALDVQGIHTISGGAWFTAEYYDRSEPFRTDGTLHAPSSHSFVSNWTTNDFHSNADLRRSFDAAYENRSLYVQMLHHPTFTSEGKLGQLRSLIRHMKSRDDVAFMTLSSFSRAVERGDLERTSEGWHYRVDRTTNGSETRSATSDVKIPPSIDAPERTAAVASPGDRR